jgi:recombination protein RecT
MGALVQSAQLGLEVGSGLGLAYLLPFRNGKTGEKDCQLIIGFRGLLELIKRSGLVRRVSAHVVYAGDTFDYAFGSSEYIKHVPCGEAVAAKITHAYAVAEYKDGSLQMEVMTKKEVDAIRDRGRRNPVWDSDYSEMARKTLVRRIAKYLPLSPDVADAMTIEHDNDSSFVTSARPDPAKYMALAAADAEAENKQRAAIADAADRQILAARFEKAWDAAKKKGKDPGKLLGFDDGHDYESESNPALELMCEKMEA